MLKNVEYGGLRSIRLSLPTHVPALCLSYDNLSKDLNVINIFILFDRSHLNVKNFERYINMSYICRCVFIKRDNL